MSYPRKIHSLVVEDDPTQKDSYEELFQLLSEETSLVPPDFAWTFSQAQEKLTDSGIYHLAIIDLGLPTTKGEIADATNQLGERVIRLAAERDAYPIPCVLVISGRLGLRDCPIRGEFV